MLIHYNIVIQMWTCVSSKIWLISKQTCLIAAKLKYNENLIASRELRMLSVVRKTTWYTNYTYGIKASLLQKSSIIIYT